MLMNLGLDLGLGLDAPKTRWIGCFDGIDDYIELADLIDETVWTIKFRIFDYVESSLASIFGSQD